MKRLLTATTALALVGGAAFAEITISGDAKFGLDYTSMHTDDDGDPVYSMSKHSFTHQMGVDFSGSGTTDGGLSFGGSAGFDTGADKTNTGNVWVSGAFGKITIGDNDPADFLAGGIADVGLNGQGVDNIVEDIRGTTKAQARYDQSVGSIALAISAGTDTGRAGTPNKFAILGGVNQIVPPGGSFEVKKNSYAIGMSFSASGARFGIGYDSKKTISAGLGYSTGQISANAFWAKRDQPYNHLGNDRSEGDSNQDLEADGTYYAGYTGLGIDVSYTMGASTLTLVHTETEMTNIQPSILAAIVYATSASFKGKGIGFSHDLGGGASLVAGFAQVPSLAVADVGVQEIGQVVATARRVDHFSDDKNVASVGLSFSF